MLRINHEITVIQPQRNEFSTPGNDASRPGTATASHEYHAIARWGTRRFDLDIKNKPSFARGPVQIFMNKVAAGRVRDLVRTAWNGVNIPEHRFAGVLSPIFNSVLAGLCCRSAVSHNIKLKLNSPENSSEWLPWLAGLTTHVPFFDPLMRLTSQTECPIILGVCYGIYKGFTKYREQKLVLHARQVDEDLIKVLNWREEFDNRLHNSVTAPMLDERIEEIYRNLENLIANEPLSAPTASLFAATELSCYIDEKLLLDDGNLLEEMRPPCAVQ